MNIPKEIAIDFIKPYILRGDSEKSIIQGYGGTSCKEYGVQMGGYVYDDDMHLLYRGKPHEIVVYRAQGQACLFRFDIYTLAKEIRLEGQGIKQMEMGFI